FRHKICWQHLGSGDTRDDCGRFRLLKPVEHQICDARLSRPRRVELGTESYNQQNWKNFNCVSSAVKDFEACRINPMHIFEDHQRWMLVRQFLKLSCEGFEHSLPTLLRRQLALGIAPIVGY